MNDYRIFFPPQLVSPGIEPVKKNLTLCQKIYYCHPLDCDDNQLERKHALPAYYTLKPRRHAKTLVVRAIASHGMYESKSHF